MTCACRPRLSWCLIALLVLGISESTSFEERANDLVRRITAAACALPRANTTEFYRTVRSSYESVQNFQHPVPSGKLFSLLVRKMSLSLIQFLAYRFDNVFCLQIFQMIWTTLLTKKYCTWGVISNNQSQFTITVLFGIYTNLGRQLKMNTLNGEPEV